jgi:Fe-S cluster biosynthesis and repair protein YggX
MSEMIHCIKLNKLAPKLKFQPFQNEFGRKIFENISQEAWQQWLSHQTMLINENRLCLADQAACDFLLTELDKYFFGAGSAKPSQFSPLKIDSAE